MTIYAAVRGSILYLATWSPGSGTGPNDHYIFVTDQLLPGATAPAPWSKTGLVAIAATKPFIGGESLSSFCGWFNAPTGSLAVKSATSSGQMEGTIDLVATFGTVPQTVYVAAAAYATANAGVLAAQGPLGDANGNIDPNEFMPLPIVALRDENADGTYDRLDPTLGFVILQVTRSNGVASLTWAAVPGKTYQVESCDQLGGSWTSLNPPTTAAAGQTSLSTTDSSGSLIRFYRVRLVNP